MNVDLHIAIQSSMNKWTQVNPLCSLQRSEVTTLWHYTNLFIIIIIQQKYYIHNNIYKVTNCDYQFTTHHNVTLTTLHTNCDFIAHQNHINFASRDYNDDILQVV